MRTASEDESSNELVRAPLLGVEVVLVVTWKTRAKSVEQVKPLDTYQDSGL